MIIINRYNINNINLFFYFSGIYQVKHEQVNMDKKSTNKDRSDQQCEPMAKS